MATHIISATEASRTLSHILNKVHYQGESFEIKRGKEVIARILPVTSIKSTIKVRELKKFFEQLPKLDEEDCIDFENTLKEIRSTMHSEDNAWD